MRRLRPFTFGVLLFCFPALTVLADPTLDEAEKQFNLKNYKDARVKFEEFVAKNPDHEKVQHGVDQVLACRLRMGEFPDALGYAKGRIEKDKGSIWEARSHRRYANLLMAAPHWGTRRGGEFHRAKHLQGERVNSFRKDRTEAIRHLDAARTIYFQFVDDKEKQAALAKEEQEKLLPETLENDFDLAGAILRRKERAQSWDWWDDFSEEGEEVEEYEPNVGYRRYRVQGSRPPSGMKVDADGNPLFTQTPEGYDSKLPDDQRVRALLMEIEAKDPTANKNMKALAIYRRAMIARARFGPDLVSRWWQRGHRRFGPLGKPLKDDPNKPEKELWELKQNEALTWVAGELKVITLPAEEDIVTLLETVAHEYSKADTADDALYAIGAFFQSRQQYPRALEAYQSLLAKFPDTSYKNQAENARNQITAKEVKVHQIGAQLTGEKTQLEISYRNVSSIQFKVQAIDLPAYLARITELNGKVVPRHPQVEINGLPTYARNMVNSYSLSNFLLDKRYNRYQKLLKGEPVSWNVNVENDGKMRPAEMTVETPIAKGGTYFVEATVVGGRQPSRSFFIVSDLVVLEKNIPNKRLYYLADAVTGAPVSNAPFTIYETWNEGRRAGNRWQQINHVVAHQAKTGPAGMFELSLPRVRRSRALHAVVHLPRAGEPVDAPKTRFTFTNMNYWQPNDPVWNRDNRARIFTVLDRPVYRPNDTVRFKIWIRKRANGQYVDSTGAPLHVEIFDAKRNKIATHDWTADKNGSVEGKLELGEEPPLGQYRIAIQSREGRNRWGGNANFRVEEYKKPEFEVSVKPGATHSKLGEGISAVVQAKYYFGAPVSDATVSYKVFRQSFRHSYIEPAPYDWLYGAGYGLIDYPYEWFPWWKRWGGCRIAPPWYRWHAPAAKQLVKHGEAAIGKDGKLEIKIDTADALKHHSDSDHRYQIQVEVTDSSRRTITGAGSVSATRQSFYAYVSTDRGWLKPKEQVTFTVKTMTPDNTPVSAKGKLTISEVKYRGHRNDEIVETVDQTFDVETGADGLAELPVRIGRSGQFRVSFRTEDPWGGEVQGNSVVWVAGDTFDGKLYRFNELEVLTDKREYKVGEIAHIMVNTAEPDSYVLFSPDAFGGVMKKYQLLRLPSRSVVIDVAVERQHEPNFYIEATVVRNGKVSQIARNLPVPTKRHFLDIQVTADKPQYKPGETGNLLVEVKDHTGEPAQTELAMAVFDRSVLYIQPETTPKIEQFFHGQKRHHHVNASHSLQLRFRGTGGVSNPYWAGQAKDWWGFWGPDSIYWPEASPMKLAQLGGRGGGRGMLAKSLRKAGAPPAPMAARAMNGAAVAEQAVAADAVMANRGSFAGAADEKAKMADKANGGGGGSAETFVEATVRTDFADTALWAPSVMTSVEGKATVPITFPQSLTSWKINAWGMSPKTQVGVTSASTITTKNLLVRLQAPRFFVERDEVIISANVHNYLGEAKKVKTEIALPTNILASGTPAVQMVEVPANGEKRVDWKVNVLREGLAEITVKALTNEESDAMKLVFPAFVHGVRKQLAQVGTMPPEKETDVQEYKFTIPAERNPEATRLSVKVSPSLAGAILDALPYLFNYEYKTVESTLSRFLPAVVTKRMLVETGLNLEAIQEKRRELPTLTPEQRDGYWTSPIFDTDELNRIVNTCLQRIVSWQHGNGGWGWWGSSRPSVYQTCYVMYCLNIAKQAGIEIQPHILNRGFNYIQGNLEREYGKIIDKNKKGEPIYRFHTSHAYACYVLSLGGRKNDQWLNTMYEKRDRLNNYGKALLCLTYHNLKNAERAGILLQNIEQYLEQDDEVGLAWLKTPNQGWWYWYNNSVETNAWFLQCYAALKPKDEAPRRLVKWLLTNRRHGHYWNSTRDTAITVNSFAQYLKASGELAPEYELTVMVDDGALGKKTFQVNAQNMFFFDNLFELSGETIGGGEHTVKVLKKGKGAAYISTVATFFTKEEDIKGAGLELRIDRSYYRLVPKTKTVQVTTTSGAKVAEEFAKMERVPLKTGDEITSGDQIEIEMMIKAKNDYDYLVFEDMKPAGCEPLDVRSGSSSQEGLWAHMELRDEKVCFFIRMLHQGEHRIRYRLRAEIPGKFHALPTKGYGMYAPDLYGTADEMRIGIKDKE